MIFLYYMFQYKYKVRIVGVAESLEYKLNMCISVCQWIARFESMFFSLTPENVKNGKVFQVFKSLDEGNISPKG